VLQIVFRDTQLYNIMMLISAEPVHVDFRTRAALIAHKHVILGSETGRNSTSGINYLESEENIGFWADNYFRTLASKNVYLSLAAHL
jgi:hypothetical protein